MPLYTDGQKATLYADDYKPLALYKDGEKVAGWHVEEKSGQRIEFDGTYNDNFEELTVYGKSEQKQYKGVQLIDIFRGETRVMRGVQSTINADGSIRFTGTFTEGGYGGAITLPEINVDGTYTFSIDRPVEGNSIVLVSSVWGKAFFVYSGNTSSTGTYSEPFKYLIINGKAGETVDVTVKVMLEKGSVKHNYEPYFGEYASPRPDSVQDIEDTETSIIVKDKRGDVKQTYAVLTHGIKAPVGYEEGFNYNYTDSNGHKWLCNTVEQIDGKWHLIERVKKYSLENAKFAYDANGDRILSNFLLPSDSYETYDANDNKHMIMCNVSSPMLNRGETYALNKDGFTIVSRKLYISVKGDYTYPSTVENFVVLYEVKTPTDTVLTDEALKTLPLTTIIESSTDRVTASAKVAD